MEENTVNTTDFRPTPTKLDFLVIAAHPDDDVLSMGAIVPTYGAERGLEGSILYIASRDPVRRREALNGAWTMGLKTRPLMAGMADVPNRERERRESEFSLEDVERTVVGFLRRYRPEVVISHDPNGEQGHWQHIRVSKAVRLAVTDAADPTYDPDSVKEYGAWQVKKLYLHLLETNPIFVSATVPLAAFGGRTAWDVAREAWECHKTQDHTRHLCNNRGENSLERFGLAFSAVGPDSGVNDFFENIPNIS